MTRPFVVLDRDGTLIVERHYLADPDQVELIEGVGEGLRRIKQLGLGLLVVTNQSGIGRGLFNWDQLDRVHRRMCDLLSAESVTLDGIYVCPHSPQDHCLCRKPLPGLIESAAYDLHFIPRASFVIGDKACDVDLGRHVGATTFLVRTGYGAQVEAQKSVAADFVVDNVSLAVPIIEFLLVSPDDRKVAYATEC